MLEKRNIASHSPHEAHSLVGNVEIILGFGWGHAATEEFIELWGRGGVSIREKEIYVKL